ncbi:hypothetical protein LH51_13895 [Nitrincola sp. A-D6]|uniref:hypothetical protein n=1 Tax=Nitrincola sp. A-D6 TaxID=1545442 RepID=UPI00051FB3A9|nr:hypothetical protein [Nitrincola sp. A-D6]KGK41569.1 hypothetical protein LH51_13895 [Nitrincola sp. A-D6]
MRADSTRFNATLSLFPAVYSETDAIQIDIIQHLADTEIFNEMDPISGLLNQQALPDNWNINLNWPEGG